LAWGVRDGTRRKRGGHKSVGQGGGTNFPPRWVDEQAPATIYDHRKKTDDKFVLEGRKRRGAKVKK